MAAKKKEQPKIEPVNVKIREMVEEELSGRSLYLHELDHYSMRNVYMDLVNEINNDWPFSKSISLERTHFIERPNWNCHTWMYSDGSDLALELSFGKGKVWYIGGKGIEYIGQPAYDHYDDDGSMGAECTKMSLKKLRLLRFDELSFKNQKKLYIDQMDRTIMDYCKTSHCEEVGKKVSIDKDFKGYHRWSFSDNSQATVHFDPKGYSVGLCCGFSLCPPIPVGKNIKESASPKLLSG